MKVKITNTKKSESSVDDIVNYEFLEDYELDMYDIEKTNPLHKSFEKEKSLYNKVKDEATIWCITGITIGGAYMIDKYVQIYLNSR
jgi:hypothetical protein